MPVLSPGRHRSPRKGACFMEMASYLAGERWSDHPTCTHPLLAGLAREINDRVGDAVRQRLVPLIPDVVGVVSTDIRMDAAIALESAFAALPVASETRQRVAAVGILRTEALLAELDGLPEGTLSPRARALFDDAPGAEEWARDFARLGWGPGNAYSRRGAPAIVHNSVAGIADACVPDPEDRLVDLLGRTIRVCRAMVPADVPASAPAARVPR
jgi:hypothetical protein